MVADRIPPQSLEAEEAVIGSILIDRSMFEVVAAVVEPSDFYAQVHESIYRAIVDLDAARRPVDKITLAEHLRDRNLLDQCGGVAYLSRMMESVPTAGSAEYYARIIREKAQLRALIVAGSKITQAGFEGEFDVPRALDDAEGALRGALDRTSTAGEGVAIGSALREAWEATSERYEKGNSAGQLTPWRGLNETIGAFFPGEMIVWGGGPKVGKTAIATMLADYLSANYGAVVYFALEMGVPAITRRLLALYSGVSVRHQRLGEVNGRGFEYLGTAMSELNRRNLTLVGRRCSRLGDIRRELRLVAAQTGAIAAFVVDHVNFISDVDVSGAHDRSNKSDRLDRVYRSLLRIADEFGCVCHAVQHVNREGMKDRPTLATLRDGGNPEGHAHAIILPYRSKPTGSPAEREDGEWIIAAAREGDAGVVPMRFIGHRAMWLDPEDGGFPWFERTHHAAAKQTTLEIA